MYVTRDPNRSSPPAATGADLPTKALQASWPDGTLAGFARMPTSHAPLPPFLDPVPAELLAVIATFAVPYGGYLRAACRHGKRSS